MQIRQRGTVAPPRYNVSYALRMTQEGLDLQSVSRTASPGLTTFGRPTLPGPMLPKAAVFLAMALLSLAPISTAQTVSPTSSTETSLHSTVRSDGSRSVSTFEVHVSSSNGQD